MNVGNPAQGAKFMARIFFRASNMFFILIREGCFVTC